MAVIKDDGTITLTDKERAAIISRIHSAKSHLEENVDSLKGFDRSWFDSESERNLALVSGTYWEKRKPDTEIFSINHIANGLGIKHAVITDGDTEFVLKPRHERFVGIADVAEKVLDDIWDSLLFDKQTDKAEWDTYIHPRGGVVELGWVYEDNEQIMRGERPFDAEESLAMAALPQDGLPLMVNGELVAPAPMEGEEEPPLTLPGVEFPSVDDAIANAELPWDYDIPSPKRDDPFIERFDPRDFYVDPQCSSHTLEDARFVFRRRWESLQSVKSNKKYRNKKDIKGTAYGYFKGRNENNYDAKPPTSVKDELSIVELYDGYVKLDLDNSGTEEIIHVIFAMESEKELLAETYQYPYFHSRCGNPFPFEVIPGSIPDNDTFKSVPDVTACRDLQVTHDLAFTQIEFKRAHTPDILLVPENIFAGPNGEATKRRIESGHQNTILEVNPAAIGVIKWLDRPLPNQEAYRTLTEAPDKIRNIIGISDYQSNIMPSKGVTATEASFLASQGSTRQQYETGRYFNFIERIAYKTLILLQQFQERTRQYAYIEEEGNRAFGFADADMLRGIVPGSADSVDLLGKPEEPGIQFTVSIDPNKKMPTSKFQERRSFIELLATLQPYAEMPDPRLPGRSLVNLPPMLRQILKTFDLTNESEIIPPDPTPEEVQMAQQQQLRQLVLMQGLQGGGDKDENPTGKNGQNPLNRVLAQNGGQELL